MSTSQNGWQVDRDGSNQDRAPIHGNVRVPNGVLAGDVATVLRWVARRYHETVEPLVAGTCWGWFVKPIEGSKTVSNHASGTAIDLNADQHPMGDAASRNMSAKQIAACHAIVRAAAGVVRWGGDYTGRPDPMHWEIVGSKTETAALAKKIRNKLEDDMAFTADDKKWLSTEVDARVKAQLDAFGKRDPLASIYARSGYLANTFAPGIAKAVAEVVPQDIDEDALAAALAAKLPDDTDDITADELKQAIVAAFHDLTNIPAASA